MKKGLDATRAFVSDLYASVKAGAAAGKDLKSVCRGTYEKLKPAYGDWVIFDHCMPFDGRGLTTRPPSTRTRVCGRPECDRQMWETLEG